MKKYLKKIKKWIILEVIANIFLVVASSSFILVQKNILDQLQYNNILNMKKNILLIIFSALGILVFSYFTMYFTWKSTINFEQMLRKDFFSKIQSFKFSRSQCLASAYAFIL